MTATIARAVNLGAPGPSGAGISAAQYASIIARLDAIETMVDPDSNTLTVTDIASFSGDVNLGNTSADIITVAGHLVASGSPPTVAAHAAAGTGGVASLVYGNNRRGLIHVAVGTSPTTGNLVTVTPAVDNYLDANYVPILTPADDNAAALDRQPFANKDALNTTFWTVKTDIVLTASTDYFFYYLVIE